MSERQAVRFGEKTESNCKKSHQPHSHIENLSLVHVKLSEVLEANGICNPWSLPKTAARCIEQNAIKALCRKHRIAKFAPRSCKRFRRIGFDDLHALKIKALNQ